MEYGGLAYHEVVLESGGEYGGVDFHPEDFTPPPTATIEGRFLVPAGYAHEDRWLGIRIGRTSINFVAQLWGRGLGDDFRYVVPVIPGTSFWIEEGATQMLTPEVARGSFIGRWEIAAGTTGLEFALEPADRLVAPDPDATGVDASTRFAWSRGGSGVHVLNVLSRDPLGPRYTIFQMDSTCTLPRFTDPELRLRADTAYWWQLGRIFPVTSVDAVASEGFVRLYFGPEGGRTYTEPRTFRTGVPPGP